MKKSADIGFYLLYIAESCEKILLYLRDMAQNDFAENQMVQDAVLRNFEIIGEAAKHVPDDFRAKYPDIKWRGMAGFRDVLIHEYFGIDLVNVWNISQCDLPEMLEQIKALPEFIAAQSSLPASEG